MKYADFEKIMSPQCMERYVKACGGDTRKAMTLYRYNLQISQEMFTIVSCFEVALRNAIDRKLTENLGADWLRDSIMPDGVFTESILRKTRDIITYAHRKLQQSQSYTHHKLLAEMEFGIWKYMFSPIQYRVTGRNLLSIFPRKPRSSRDMQYNQSYIFNELDKVNSLRNRIAHHETICFASHTSTIDTSYVINVYNKIKTLFSWMDVDCNSLLYGLDHVSSVCDRINELKAGL
ncbi:MAG: Abi family protein [Muribaculaceae bacterium]|nr:Abi family protein [Muribaculaceae bacterium]